MAGIWALPEDGGPLERAAPATSWRVPSTVELDGNRLRWRHDGGDTRAAPSRGMVTGFGDLLKESDSHILRFSRKWGVLGKAICAHSIPGACDDCDSSALRSSPDEGLGASEQLENLAERVIALLNIGANLRNSRSGEPRHWRLIHDADGPFISMWRTFRIEVRRQYRQAGSEDPLEPYADVWKCSLMINGEAADSSPVGCVRRLQPLSWSGMTSRRT